MPQQGAVPFSFRSDAGWRGMTTTSRTMPFHFDLLENVYVSGDGGDIRTFPGFVCVVDPVTDARLATDTSLTSAPFGYERFVNEARRPVTATASTNYIANTAVGSITDSMYTWNRPTTLHGVEQVHGRWIFFGESSDRFEPVYNSGRTAFVYITSYDDNGGTSVDLTLNSAPDTTTTLFNCVASGNRIYVEGLTGALASLLNGKSHDVTGVSGAVVTISTNPGGTISAVTGQTGTVARITPDWTSGASTTAAQVSDDEESLTIWTATERGDPNGTLVESVYPAHVANRQRDFGDATGTIIPGCTNTTAGQPGRSRRRQLPLPYRIVPHVAGNRLIMAAPGYGCVFQAPVITPIDPTEASASAGIPWTWNDIYDKPRALGVPKAVQHEDPDGAVGTSLHIADEATLLAASFPGAAGTYSFGGSNAAVSARSGTYKFAFAYKDEATGEVGLMSEPVAVTTTTATVAYQAPVFRIYFPGYLLHESLALSINVYRTTKDGNSFYFDRTIPMRPFINGVFTIAESGKYGLLPSSILDENYHHVYYAAIYQSDEDLAKKDSYVPEVLEQMPMGCKVARTIRGFTFFGGSMGDAGPFKELKLGTATVGYDKTSGVASNYYNYNELTCRFTAAASVPPTAGMEVGFGCAAKNIPPAYAGQTIFSRSLFPYPRHGVQLNKLINTISGGGAVKFPDVRFSVLDTPLRAEAYVNGNDFNSKNAYVILPRGRLQISEPDNPGVTPATNTTTVANELDEDIEGIGDANGQAVVCTRSKTYFLGFSGSPIGVQPDVASDRFGCIAPNSMVEFDGGCAWLSDRGPVAMMGGAPTWIGEPLERLFTGDGSRYLRDRDGMMRHSWGCHDAERGLLYFGVFANRARGTAHEIEVSYRGTSYSWSDTDSSSDANQIRSRFPCDEVLVYSYRVGAWSIWRPSLNMAIQWMARGLDAKGNNRVHFLGSDKRLYVLDDAYGSFSKESNKTAVALEGAVTTVTGLTVGGSILAGMTAAFYTGGDGEITSLVGTRTITSKTTTSVTLDSSITLPAGGCTMLVGPHVGTIRTTFANWKKDERSKVGRVGIRYSLWSPYVIDPTTYNPQASFLYASCISGEKRDGVLTVKSAALTGDGTSTYTPLGETQTTEHVFERTAELGAMSGKNHQLEIQLVGGAQVRISDLYVEVS